MNTSIETTVAPKNNAPQQSQRDIALTPAALDQIFRTARTRNAWTDRLVSDALMRDVYDLAKMGPTSANSNPARFVWVRSAGGKAKLAALAMDSNKAKIMQAPVTVIVGYDLLFAEHLGHLAPFLPVAYHAPMKLPQAAEPMAFRNSSLQGAYLIIAARALGLDCGPMSGFDNQGVDEQFFAGTHTKSNFICSLGYGSDEKLFPRQPRLDFDVANTLV